MRIMLLIYNIYKKTSSVKIEEVKIDNSTSVTKEIKVYTEEDRLNKVPEKIKNIYLNLRDIILELDDIDLEVKKSIYSV